MNYPYIVLYDGDCGFCNFWVKWILKYDKKEFFFFAPLQGDYGQSFLQKLNKSSTELDTLYVIKSQEVHYQKLDAVIQIGNALGGRFRIFNAFRIFPPFLKNSIYDLVARNRKKLMQSNCYLPTPNERKRFLK